MDLGIVAGAPHAQWIAQPPHEPLQRRIRPTLPENDPFYKPPVGYHHARPGTVLRSREVELAFLGLIPQRLTATQLLYRTTDKDGSPEAAVTTVLLPTERDPQNPRPLLSYQCAIDAMASRCFPSYALRWGAMAVGASAQIEYLTVAAALAEGWAVSVPDHEGPNGTWGAPHEPGYRVLDGARAALSGERLGLTPSSPVGLCGYSGGGLASAWAAEVCGEYAPELNVVGAVLGSPVGDPGNTFHRLNGSLLTGLPALMVAALVHVYPELDRVIQQHVTDEGRSLLVALEKMTTVGAIFRLLYKDLDSYIDTTLEEILSLPEVQDVLDDIKLGTAIPATPLLIVQAVHDSVVAVEDIDALAETYLAGGAEVTYHRDRFSEHLLLRPMSLPMTFRWLKDRFAGRPLTDHMVRTTWPTLLNPMTYRGMARWGIIAGRVVTGRSINRRPL
jgi:Secretory lipase